jgi:Zn-dependent peptidase ImmA (M78 family)
MAARSSRVLRREAVRLLERFGVLAPPVPIDVIARNLGAEVRFLPYEGELAGMLARTDDRVVIGVNSLHHRNRQRFTIAHEIAHLLLHDLETHFDRNFRVRHRDAVSSAAVDDHEIEANRFAAELLMPHAMLLADLDEAGIDVEQLCDIAPLARRYSVSKQAMMHRVAHLAHI